MDPNRADSPLNAGQALFATTHWSVVVAAGEHPRQGAREALTRLCETYWYPLYAYARRQGCKPEEAQDFTQGFFARLLEQTHGKIFYSLDDANAVRLCGGRRDAISFGFMPGRSGRT